MAKKEARQLKITKYAETCGLVAARSVKREIREAVRINKLDEIVNVKLRGLIKPNLEEVTNGQEQTKPPA
ncbi:hypothetical protein UFOVP1328_8 [uncultured Caudovirales phage]|uniref:Uncharacterized protein n=1 Tax=uncultured Caudovirales phage TaxID=2100421 RepID=A0A6J5RNP6_9CAUD|nr:hypothetical protein UFOVP1084_8 [uncultured Caudovirales phage]CAB4198983.1 hypothetical protein UFOVP1328_8 [uncultured Caudovirales phage]CAB5228398.1 hypothetical protein UFOVP1532_39 [uncultured Caudovirales phage]